jgi:hypothetical protein
MISEILAKCYLFCLTREPVGDMVILYCIVRVEKSFGTSLFFIFYFLNESPCQQFHRDI